MQNDRGEWVAPIPLAYRVYGLHQCECGRRFLRGAGYRGHYALAHIMGLS